ncbi:Nucleotide-binding universal stress protein, UspA family [Desulfotomaculum arcticum]|uniref:Nucleotide-binding universal stress protein, UspA family n=1 Tax=Desulfotruncus arcticus DSM 17038 TaxID=1121424 RepID=A0A1I2YH45_9FIRM|nr:universal stress protein [Desulfotruncus arcticus]SFH24910.1 Nucleotide-binding universal stress protein, UspA family [Desulfotomaculum arcticum] [Desulfotruncus arcticus DSM 17038]
MIKKILLAFDGSQNALRAAKFAVDLQKSIPEARCVIIIVASFTKDEAEFLGASATEFDNALQINTNHMLQSAMELFKSEGLKVEKVTLQGDIAQSIVAYAGEHNIDLIVMGTRGLGNVKGMLLGSVSNKVIHLAHCPVTVVK